MTNYYSKYLKYKTKYILLKKQIDNKQFGGDNDLVLEEDRRDLQPFIRSVENKIKIPTPQIPDTKQKDSKTDDDKILDDSSVVILADQQLDID